MTFGFSLSIADGSNFIRGFNLLKLQFVSILVPRGVPLILAPILGVIETLSYMIRALSLESSVRGECICRAFIICYFIRGLPLRMFFNGYLFLGCFLIFIDGVY